MARKRPSLPDEFAQPWLRSERPVPRLVVRPLERFLSREAGSASLLMLAAVAALVWINLAPDSYASVWETRIAVELGELSLEEDVRHWINDLLMAVFFYVVALEVKRETLFGSLRDRRSAAVPVAAALGTMAGAAATYVAVNIGGDLRGWAIPIATDIAFALGVLGLAGKRAPRELRAFLLTLAVVDDLGTILVIAVFFTEEISLAWLGAAAGTAIVVYAARRIGVRFLVAYVLLAAGFWIAVFESGVHATMAGVVLGFLTPARPFHSPQATSELVGGRLSEIADSDAEIGQATLLEAARVSEEAVSPLARMEERLHPWTAYGILPLFALANAGVPVSLDGVVDALTSAIGLGIALGLVVGAPLGGMLFAWSIVAAGPARMPEGLDWPAIGGVAPLKGIGFTIAIFITGLAFDEREIQQEATLAILIASATAGVIGLTVLFTRHAMLARRRR